jgi:hypothetical protein
VAEVPGFAEQLPQPKSIVKVAVLAKNIQELLNACTEVFHGLDSTPAEQFQVGNVKGLIIARGQSPSSDKAVMGNCCFNLSSAETIRSCWGAIQRP